MAPPYLLGAVTREEIESKLQPYEEGKFAVRQREDVKGQYVLCVVFKGKPTHHLCAKNPAGHWTVNKKVYSAQTDLGALIAALGKPGVPGWPVPLDKPYGGDGAKLARKRSSTRGSTKSSGSGKAAGSMKQAKWLHGAISREKSEALLTSDGSSPEGRFLVRKRDGLPGQFVLSVIYKGQVTQHLCAKNDEGIMCVNKRAYGENRTIKSLIALLGSKKNKPANWPVRLSEGCDTQGNLFAHPEKRSSTRRDSTLSTGSDASETVSEAASAVPESAAAAAPAAGRPWLHKPMSHAEAAEHIGDQLEDGTFLVREHQPGKYAITVVYKGKPTHHLIKVSDDGESMVNNKPTGATGLDATIEAMRTRKPWWPVPLKEHIPGTAGGGEAAPEPVPVPVPEPEPEPESEPQAAAPPAAPEPEPEPEPRAPAPAPAPVAAAAAVAEDTKVTGFYQLANPFPQGVGHAAQNPPGELDAATLLAQARALAAETAAGLSPEVKAKYNVGRLLGLDMQDSSTDDLGYQSGAAGTSAGLAKLAEAERDIKVLKDKTAANTSQIGVLHAHLSKVDAAQAMRTEIDELRAKHAFLEKKLGMMEKLLLETPTDDGKGKMAKSIEVRLLPRASRGLPSTRDLANAHLLGKLSLLSGSTYAEVRATMLSDFDDEYVPEGFKFFVVVEGDSNLLKIHQKQEAKVPADSSVVYCQAASGV